MKISVCIPMYNENRIIAETAKVLSGYMASHFDDYEILFCDDGSHDGCGDTVRSLQLPFVRVVGYAENRGKGCAVRTAMLEADGDIRIFSDADLAYGTDVIEKIVETFGRNPGADMVIGSRNLGKDGYREYTWFRRIASKLYIRILCFAGGFRLSDSQCGCKAFSGAAAERIFSMCEVDRFAFDFEVILLAERFGMQIAEMPVQVIHHADSKVRVFRDTFRMLRDLRRIKRKIRKIPSDVFENNKFEKK